MNRMFGRAVLGCLVAASAALYLALQETHPAFARDTQATQADKKCQAYHDEMQGHRGDVSYATKTIGWCLKAERGNFALSATQSGEAQQLTELRHARAMQYGAEASLTDTQESGRPLDVFRKANRINNAILRHSRSPKIHDRAATQFMEVATLIAYAKAQAATPKS